MNKLLLLALPLGLFGASGLPYFVNDIHGYLPKNQGDIGIEVLKMNDVVDILNIKEDEFGGNLSETSIGDMNGLSIFGRYKLRDDLMIGAKYQKSDISFGLGELNNKKLETYLRKNLLSKNFAVDFGIIQNSANDISPKNLNLTDNRINDITNATDVTIVANIPNNDGDYICSNLYSHCLSWTKSDGQIFKEGINSSSFKDAIDSKDINYDVTTKNMKDNTLFIRAIKSVYNDIDTVDISLAYSQTKITTEVETNIYYKNEELNALQNLDRNENKITLGINYSAFVGKWAMDALYEYDYFLRDDDLGYINHNHKIDINIGYEIFKNVKFFVGGKIMSNQFNGEIPYLYNKYTQTSFDHKYGWAKTGLVYSF